MLSLLIPPPTARTQALPISVPTWNFESGGRNTKAKGLLEVNLRDSGSGGRCPVVAEPGIAF